MSNKHLREPKVSSTRSVSPQLHKKEKEPDREHHKEHHKREKEKEKFVITVDPSSDTFRQTIFHERNMCCAITITGGSARNAAVKLAESPPEMRTTNEIHREQLVSQSEWTKTLINNGFNQASVKALFPMVSTELTAARQKTSTISTMDSKQAYHHVIYYTQAVMMLRKEIVIPTDEFVKAVEDALEAGTVLDKYQRLKSVFEQFGYVWAQKVSLGGKLTLSENLSEHQNDQERKSKALAEARANVDAAAAGLQASVGAGFKSEKEKVSSHSSDVSYLRSHLNVIGGEATNDAFDNGRASWEESLKNPYLWQIIVREDLIPIYELLDEETQTTVKTVMDAAISLERVTTNSTVTLRNYDTNHSLSWKKFYYGKMKNYPGMVVTTCPMMSGENNENMQWRFVRRRSGDADMYICYGDSVYIKPVKVTSGSHSNTDRTADRLFLHGSYHQDAPVTKVKDAKAFEVSLRYFSSHEQPNENDEWVIERGDDGVAETGGDIDLDTNMRKTSFVHKSDRFRLRHRATDEYYLASHRFTLENVRVRRNAKESHPHFMGGPPCFKDIKNGGEFSNRFNEVLMLDRDQLAGTKKDQWEFFKVEAHH